MYGMPKMCIANLIADLRDLVGSFRSEALRETILGEKIVPLIKLKVLTEFLECIVPFVPHSVGTQED